MKDNFLKDAKEFLAIEERKLTDDVFGKAVDVVTFRGIPLDKFTKAELAQIIGSSVRRDKRFVEQLRKGIDE